MKIEGPPTQYLYKMVIAYFVKRDPARKPLHKAVTDQRLTDLSELRNAAVHRFDDITPAKLRAVWREDPAGIVLELRRLAELAGIANVEHSPYSALRGALGRLLA